jgi:hypothetical protein
MLMSAEIFRFVTVRPPRQTDTSASTGVVDLGLAQTPLAGSLRDARPTGTRATMTAIAEQFIASPEFINGSAKVDPKLLAFTSALLRLPDLNFGNAARQAFAAVFDSTPANFVQTPAFSTAYGHIADSIVAAAIDGGITPNVRALLVRTERSLWLIRRLAANDSLSREEFLRAPVLMPQGIFPLPVSGADLRAQRQAQAAANQAYLQARQKQLAQLTSDLESNRTAIDELLGTFERTGAQQPPSTTVAGTASQNLPAVIGFQLPDASAQALTTTTKGALQKIGVATTQIDVAKSVTLLEKRSAAIAIQLYTATGPTGTMVRVGNRIFPKDALVGANSLVIDPGPASERSPGPCPPIPDTTPPAGSVTVPTGHGEARILGIADLMVVEQDLLRYQLGEIAHIENVLKSETRSRKFKTVDTIQQTQTTEVETTEDKEQDLASTTRFELQTESQTVISDNASKNAGLTIHASYGPSVDATANLNVSSSTSSEQSKSASSNFAREITTKAVDRVQTRTLTRRTVTVTHMVEEINDHGFDNKAGTADIVGVYRFVDKIYLAQIVNYGKRLMLEFIVPEPAAFLRYALTNKPVDDVTLVNPDPPGYCLANGTSFAPLQASDITPDNYLYWTSKYGAQDVTSPPPSVVIASGSQKAPDSLQTIPDSGDRKINSDLFDIAVPDGYLTQSAFVNIYAETQAGVHRIVFQVQEQQGVYVEPVDDNRLFYLHLQPTPSLTVTMNSIGFHNYEVVATVFCTLSDPKYQDWQLKTFTSIMNAYNDQKSAYDEAIKEARANAADSTVSGTNPENNRVTEQTELKKGCISLLTGQRFELFDAMNRNMAPYGYPEIDFAEAKAEGEYIRAFEQSFEWNNMVYLFYPYFWGRKDDWVTVAQLSDDDPLFGQFLRAGAARVQVPVRVGFEEAVLTYLSTGELWTEGTLINSEGDAEPDLSIIDELKSQLGDNNVDGPGTVNVTKNSGAVTGIGTAFTADDVSRRIIIAGVTYVIRSVQDAHTITITTPHAGERELVSEIWTGR